MSDSIHLNVVINGNRIERDNVPATELLVSFLHEELDLTGTKLCCGVGACGTCKVVVRETEDGPALPTLSCFARLQTINGMHITTVEGIGTADNLHPLQKAFLDHYSFQCGYSTPGFLMAGYALMDQLKRSPIRRKQLHETILGAINGNLCRCTGYLRYYRAIKQVIEKTPGLIQDDIKQPIEPMLIFQLEKQSGNDETPKPLIGFFRDSTIRAWFEDNPSLDTLNLEIDLPLSGLDTGIDIRNLNLRRFLFGDIDTLTFRLTTIKARTRHWRLDSHQQTPVTFEGTVRCGKVTVTVSSYGNIELTTDGQLVWHTHSPASVQISALGLPIGAFAKEFGLTLGENIEILADFTVPCAVR